jgi:threonyl-tRNA synthetase
VAQELSAAGLRVETDLRNEKINYKVREHSLAKTPVIAVVGRREAEEGKVALRRLGSDGQTVVSLAEAVKMLASEALPPDVAIGSAGAVAARAHDSVGAEEGG